MKKKITVSVISSHIPRECGVGEFNYDLISNLQKLGGIKIIVYAIDNIAGGYKYPKEVVEHFYYQDRAAYKKIADKINNDKSDICLLQHEFNLFGGDSNDYIFDLINNLNKKLVIVLHTIPLLKDVSRYKEKIEHIKKLEKKTSLFISISRLGAEGLKEMGIPLKKIKVIQHGSPEMPPLSKAKFYKKSLDLKGYFVVMTFGLIRRGKGLEFLIDAVREVKDEIPNIKCLIIGTQDKGGDLNYLSSLKQKAIKQDLSKIVKFVDYFIERKKLFQYIRASDVIATPYIRRDKISSGVLTFALGGGIPVISTPYIIAEELIGDIGILVPMFDSYSIANAIKMLALDKAFYKNQKNKVIKLGKDLSWSKKAREYKEIIAKVVKY